jgi:hypothetical protein
MAAPALGFLLGTAGVAGLVSALLSLELPPAGVEVVAPPPPCLRCRWSPIQPLPAPSHSSAPQPLLPFPAANKSINRFALVRKLSSDKTGIFNSRLWDGMARK